MFKELLNQQTHEFAEKLLTEIKQKSVYMQGPENGPWPNGLLSLYYEHLKTTDGKKLWSEVFSTVDTFLPNEDNSKGIIPLSLFHVNRKSFTPNHLRTVLLHRLCCLHRQFQEGKVLYEQGIKKWLNLEIKNPKAYFQSMLGFSITFDRQDQEQHIGYIQPKGLFPEERQWLEQKFPQRENLEFPELIETIISAADYFPNSTKTNFPKSMNSLSDCYEAIKLFPKLSGKKRTLFDMRIEFESYLENQHEEISRLKQHDTGGKIHALMVELVNRYKQREIENF